MSGEPGPGTIAGIGGGIGGGAGGARIRACLVDVYETLLRYDFQAHSRAMATLAGVEAGAWQRAQIAAARDFDSGRLSMEDTIALILTRCGIVPRPELVARLARADAEAMAGGCDPYPEAAGFLHGLRDRGLKIALVSNCGPDTRPLLARLNLIPLADAVILSCEVGHVKPEPEIYRRALDALGVRPEEAVMIDDQPSYCSGAEAAGIRAIQIARDSAPPDPRFRRVFSLLDIPPLLRT